MRKRILDVEGRFCGLMSRSENHQHRASIARLSVWQFSC